MASELHKDQPSKNEERHIKELEKINKKSNS